MQRLFDNRHVLGLLFMLPAGGLLLLFLTYPLGLGTWLGFTDAKIGRAGQWVGLDNFQYLVGDAVALLSLFNTLFYTAVASVIKFALACGWRSCSTGVSVQVVLPCRRAASLHRAHGAFRACLLVDV